MGHDKIRHLVFHYGRWVWRPTKRMCLEGFGRVRLGPGTIVDGKPMPDPADIARAMELNQEWDRHRRGLPPLAQRLGYPAACIGDGYQRAMAMRAKGREAEGIVWTSEHHSRDDWPRAWKRIGPLFGDCDPKTVTPEMLQQFRIDISAQVSEGEAHRVIKVWRALWKKMGSFGFCDKDNDPSLGFANSAPKPRQDVWLEGEAVRLVKEAWRSGYKGMAVLLAVAWDSQLSPIDARNLRIGDMRRDPVGTWFDVARAKTGRDAIATLCPRTVRLLRAYLAELPAEPMGAVKIFNNRSCAPYSKDTLGDDFRTVRGKVFGPQEKRQLADFRRSGATEALAGNASLEDLSNKMANTLSASNRLHATYARVRLASVRDVDAARKVGRTKIRTKSGQKFPSAGPKVPEYHSGKS
jgi:hypothetical protein